MLPQSLLEVDDSGGPLSTIANYHLLPALNDLLINADEQTALEDVKPLFQPTISTIVLFIDKWSPAYAIAAFHTTIRCAPQIALLQIALDKNVEPTVTNALALMLPSLSQLEELTLDPWVVPVPPIWNALVQHTTLRRLYYHLESAYCRVPSFPKTLHAKSFLTLDQMTLVLNSSDVSIVFHRRKPRLLTLELVLCDGIIGPTKLLPSIISQSPSLRWLTIQYIGSETIKLTSTTPLTASLRSATMLLELGIYTDIVY